MAVSRRRRGHVLGLHGALHVVAARIELAHLLVEDALRVLAWLMTALSKRPT
jgi:hypothetical protein